MSSSSLGALPRQHPPLGWRTSRIDEAIDVGSQEADLAWAHACRGVVCLDALDEPAEDVVDMVGNDLLVEDDLLLGDDVDNRSDHAIPPGRSVAEALSPDEEASVICDRTVMLDSERKVNEQVEEKNKGRAPLLTLVTLNSATACTFDVPLDALTGLKDCSEDSAVAARTVSISCGRNQANTIVLEDNRVSFCHFTIRARAVPLPGAESACLRVALELLDQSSNGTFVNGLQVGRGRSTPLAIGDRIVVLPSERVGRAAEIGYMLLPDAKGAQCGGHLLSCAVASTRASSASSSPDCISENSSYTSPPVSPKAVEAGAINVVIPRELEQDLRCGICADTLYRCLTLVPCGHNFCLACLVKWRRVSPECPECRSHIRQAVPNQHVDHLVSIFLGAHPEASRAPADFAVMDSIEADANNKPLIRWLLNQREWVPDLQLTSHTPRLRGGEQTGVQVSRVSSVGIDDGYREQRAIQSRHPVASTRQVRTAASQEQYRSLETRPHERERQLRPAESPQSSSACAIS